ncbi:MAG: DHH family phosphoesterase [Clostridiales bacterium]|nr:DHH family phosphoesterase [Clostridiales bacterium]
MTKLDELVQCITHTHVYVQMHNYPDQDALSSAMGLQVLLKSRNIDSTLIYYGVVDKENTLKMIEMLHVELYPADTLQINKDDEIIIVDSQKGNLNITNTVGMEIACIDHHTPHNVEDYRFYDIRENVGACASIIASYFEENNIDLSTEIATALVYGLKMDTAQLTRRISKLDFDMFCHLFQKADATLLRIFEMSSLKLKELVNYMNAIADLKIDHNVAIANIGNNCSEAIIGSVNDFLLTISEISFSVIYSYRAEGIKFSVRSALMELNAGEIIHEALNGLGDGGGHSDMAAGIIPNITDETLGAPYVDQVIQRIIQYIQKKGTVKKL